MSDRGYWYEGKSGYTAMAWLLECVPGVPAAHVPVLLGRGLEESEARALRDSGWARLVREEDPFTGARTRILAGPWWADRKRAFGWYQRALWNPVMGAGILASMAEPGDWLLLGEDLRRWGRNLGIDDGLIRHWSVKEGGSGAGFLVKHRGGVKQEWVFLMERRFASYPLEDTLHRFLQEISPILQLGSDHGLNLTVRLMWTTARTAEKGLSCHATISRMREVQRLLRELQRPSRRDGSVVPPKGVKWEHGLVYNLGQSTGWKMALWEPENQHEWRRIPAVSGALWSRKSKATVSIGGNHE